MDMYCPRCAEPWDNDFFHEVAEEKGQTYRQTVDDFYQRGCVALGGSQCERTGSLRAEMSAVLRDVMGDDTDGIMSELDSAEHLGLFRDED